MVHGNINPATSPKRVSYSVRVNLSDFLGLHSSLTYIEGEDLEFRETLRHVSPTFGTSGIAYVNKKLRAEFYAVYNAPIAFDDLAPSERSKTHIYSSEGSLAWYTLNLKANYRFKTIYSFNIGIENLLDLHYRPYSSGISAAGRNLYVSLRVDL